MAWSTPRTWVTDELVTAALMNGHVRDQFNAVMHLVARKTADQSVVSSTTLVNDTALVLPVAANEIWRFDLMMFWSAALAGDLKWGFTVPAGATFNASTVWPLSGGGVNASPYGVITSGGTGNLETIDASSNLTVLWGLIVNGSTAGSLQFQFAQYASNATATTVKVNSTLMAMKLA